MACRRPASFHPAMRTSNQWPKYRAVRFFSLQKGFGTEQLAQWKTRWPITELGDKLHDFMDTAAVMANMDLIISSDTSPVHLAGALGRPVWAALSFGHCWRWLQHRIDSPWYPTMRLFRQPKPGDWQTVFQEIAAELVRQKERLQSRSSSDKP